MDSPLLAREANSVNWPPQKKLAPPDIPLLQLIRLSEMPPPSPSHLAFIPARTLYR
jgi:hypothetical protein